MDEFGLIRKYFAPLAAEYEGSLALCDDAAIVDVPKGKELVITKDAISEGVHFLGSEDADLIAKKLLRVNLSDLAAMGAQPLCYFLAAILPKQTEENWVAEFARGLFEDQGRYAVYLAGGDTISTQGKLSFSITALGTVEKGKALRRSGAKPGDKIYVSGTVGDSALGLKMLQGGLSATPAIQKYLEQKYFLPEPHIALGQRLVGIASACMDVSDGLAQDLGHIAGASQVGAVIFRNQIPRSKQTQALLAKDDTLWKSILGGGDDYQLLFTVPAAKEKHLPALANELQLPLTSIGEIREGRGVAVLDENKKPLAEAKGFSHF
jgi:thiamine-monophosphate kinase